MDTYRLTPVRERAVELVWSGLPLAKVAEVLNHEGYRPKRASRFTYQTAYHCSRYKGGEICPRSGLWVRTCKISLNIGITVSAGDRFSACPICDNCKWRIIPPRKQVTNLQNRCVGRRPYRESRPIRVRCRREAYTMRASSPVKRG